jgi:hypothetical protein
VHRMLRVDHLAAREIVVLSQEDEATIDKASKEIVECLAQRESELAKLLALERDLIKLSRESQLRRQELEA